MSQQIGSRKYSTVALELAVSAVRCKSLSVRAASRCYGIPRSTLFDKVTAKSPMTPAHKTVLTPAEEQRLVDWSIEMAKIGYGRTRKEIMNTVKKIIDVDGRPNPFTDNRPGKDWWYGFIRRHPELSERTPQQLGKERAVITPDKLKAWFQDLRNFITDEIKDPGLLSDPSRMYNADESGFSMAHKSGKIMSERGTRHVYNFTSSDKSQITILACMSAVGHFLRPMIVFPGQRFSYNPIADFPESVFGRSDNGWMDAELFFTWLKDVFVPAINERAVKKPVLLFVDGHSTHISLAVSDLCRANGVVLYCLLEHASHLIQPCDLMLFNHLKESWTDAVREFQDEHPGEFVTKPTFAGVFRKAWQKSSTIDIAVKGFRDAGLFPLNEERILSTVKMEPSKIFCSLSKPETTVVQPQPPIAQPQLPVVQPQPPIVQPQPPIAQPEPPVVQAQPHTVQPQPPAVQPQPPVVQPQPPVAQPQPPVFQPQPPVVQPQPPVVQPPPAVVQPQPAVVLPQAPAVQPQPPAVQPQPPVVQPQAPVVQPQLPVVQPQPRDPLSVSPAFSVLKIPAAKRKVPGNRRQCLPKAVTGEQFRSIMMAKKQKQEEEERAKIERKQLREQKKAEKEREKLIKRQKREEKIKRKEADKKTKDAVRRRKRRARPEKESSDSGDAEPILSDGSGVDVSSATVNQDNCSSCDLPFSNIIWPFEWVRCVTCSRRTHKKCVRSIDLSGLTEEEIEDMHFECDDCL